MKKEEKREKRVEIQEKEEQLMINLNEAKLMNEENWIETTTFFLLFSCVSAIHSCSIVSSISDLVIFFFFFFFFLFCKFLHQFLQILLHFCCFC